MKCDIFDIKVASMGLKPNHHLGKTLKQVSVFILSHNDTKQGEKEGETELHFALLIFLTYLLGHSQLYPTLLALEASCGLSVCGEGGEYETLTVGRELFDVLGSNLFLTNFCLIFIFKFSLRYVISNLYISNLTLFFCKLISIKVFFLTLLPRLPSLLPPYPSE